MNRDPGLEFGQQGLTAKRGTGGPEVAALEADCGAALVHPHDKSFRDQIQVHLFVQQDGPTDA
jgi:hypothetical protein